MEKRKKIVLATISVAGYSGGRKVTNTFNWKVFLIDEKDPDGLIERKKQKLLAVMTDKVTEKCTGVEFRAKVVKKEEHFVDTFLTADTRLIGSTTETKGTLKQI